MIAWALGIDTPKLHSRFILLSKFASFPPCPFYYRAEMSEKTRFVWLSRVEGGRFALDKGLNFHGKPIDDFGDAQIA